MQGDERVTVVTGGCGFIGANFVLDWIEQGRGPLINLDKLTYAGNPRTLAAVESDARYRFVHGDICDRGTIDALLGETEPQAIVHFAAESHVDRSIVGPGAFIETNIQGTFVLLEAVRAYLKTLPQGRRDQFRFLHVSTDEVYGSLGAEDPAFREDTAYAPNSPYAASKAASDHLVRAYGHTYHVPAMVTNCSNNYGPYQFPEKLIPLMIESAIGGRPLPVYGDGLQVRDWLYVKDHCAALRLVLDRGAPGQTYNIGGSNERTNLSMTQTICSLLDEAAPAASGASYAAQITFVEDRSGHDRRYAIDASKIKRELGWAPATDVEQGLRLTVGWYLRNRTWVEGVVDQSYRNWMKENYAGRGVL